LLIIWLTPCNIASLFFLILCLLLIFHVQILPYLKLPSNYSQLLLSIL
jgi:hypothetical protein